MNSPRGYRDKTAAPQFGTPRDQKQLASPFTAIHPRELDPFDFRSNYALRDLTDVWGWHSPSSSEFHRGQISNGNFARHDVAA
jgi:hypothetical protein